MFQKIIFPSVPPSLDEGLGLAAVVDLDIDLGILVLLVSEALEVAAVAEQVEGQAESQHAQQQQAHVHLNTASDQHHERAKNQSFSVQRSNYFQQYTLHYSFMSIYSRHLTHRGSPFRGPTMAMKRGCWSRANRALIRDCMPVRLPN